MSRNNSRTPVTSMSQPLPTKGCTWLSVPHFVTKRVAAAVILKQSEELLHICSRQRKDNQEDRDDGENGSQLSTLSFRILRGKWTVECNQNVGALQNVIKAF